MTKEICFTPYRDKRGRFSANPEAPAKPKRSRKTPAAEAAPPPAEPRPKVQQRKPKIIKLARKPAPPPPPAPAAKPKQTKPAPTPTQPMGPKLPPAEPLPDIFRKPIPISKADPRGRGLMRIYDPSTNETIGVSNNRWVLFNMSRPIPKQLLDGATDPIPSDKIFKALGGGQNTDYQEVFYIGNISRRAKLLKQAFVPPGVARQYNNDIHGLLDPKTKIIWAINGESLRALIGHLPKRGFIRFGVTDYNVQPHISVFYGAKSPPRLWPGPPQYIGSATKLPIVNPLDGFKETVLRYQPTVTKGRMGAKKLKLKRSK